MGEVATHPAAEPGAPERLTAGHDLEGFRSREPELDDRLRRHALRNEGPGSRTYVVCAGRRVVGFYALANGAVQREVAARKLRRNAPNPVPVMVLGRLAVARECEGRGIGSGLLKDAIRRTLQAAEIAGVAAILVHAISDEAKGFYERRGFTESELEPMTLMISLRDALAELG